MLTMDAMDIHMRVLLMRLPFLLMQDAFARCLGGLLTVVAQEVKVTVTCAQGVTIQQVLSGAYRHSLAYDNSETTVSLGEMYAEEKRHLLLDVTINPVTRAMGHPLLTATCTYMGGPQFLLEVHVTETVLSVVEREEGGEGGEGGEEEVAVAVDRERNRLQTAYAIAQVSRAYLRACLLQMHPLLCTCS